MTVAILFSQVIYQCPILFSFPTIFCTSDFFIFVVLLEDQGLPEEVFMK